MSYIIGIDVGGTFTDFVAYEQDSGEVEVWKNFSTPGDPSEGILQGLRGFQHLSAVNNIRLGTTIATNAILERRGAVVAYVTTAGFRDVPFIQRGNRRYHFGAHWVKPEPLVRREHCFEVNERVDCDGNIRIPLDTHQVREIAARIREYGMIEAVAVCLLFSYITPDHERQVCEVLAQELPGIPISASFEVLPKWKEYERASTTLADAYLKPIVSTQLSNLETRLREFLPDARLAIIKSNSGEASVAGVLDSPVQITLSGPTGGVVAAQFVGNKLGENNFVTLDIGGTSTDCALCIDGNVALTTDFEIEWGLPIQIPMVDVRTVGAGGGSIAWLDKGGLLHVGPGSAGAKPGPVCYGRGGTEPTVTDANVVLGRINPDNFLGGTLALDIKAAESAIGELAQRVGLSLDDMAMAIVRIANNSMVGALRSVLIEKGHNPAKFALMGFGGAGPVHIGDLLADMKMPRAIVPLNPGQFSAFGFIATDARVDRQRTVEMTSKRMDQGRANAVLGSLVQECVKQLNEQGYRGEIRVLKRAELRYHGQNYELELPIAFEKFTDETSEVLWNAFHQAHQDRFGFSIPGDPIELVNFNATAVLEIPKPRLGHLSAKSKEQSTDLRSIGFEGWGRVKTPVYRRGALYSGQNIEGPVVVEEPASVTCVRPDQRLQVDEYGSLIVTMKEGN